MTDARRNFDLEAMTWDEKPQRVKMAKDLVRAIGETVELSPTMDALDYGCGTGLVTLQLATRVGRVLGVDSSQGMLDVLEQKRQACQADNVTVRRLDLDSGQVLEGSFDLVVSTMTFHHVHDVASLLHQFASILKPGGRVCIADLDSENGDFHGDNTGVFHFGFERKALRDMMSEAGFVDLADRTAAEVEKPDPNGTMKTFTVFLMTGRRAGQA